MAVKGKIEAQNPLILRCHRLMDAFAKSDDERDFYLDRNEGFIIYVDLNKSPEDIESLEKELTNNADRYCLIPKLTFYETKKIMEGFVNEKVYDIDTKEKLLDIIQSKDARANFIEFIQDHHSELEKWQQYYQERGRIRIIEWLRRNHFNFVFEEDLEMSRNLIEKLKEQLFQTRVGKDIMTSRKLLINKAKTYYSTEALNPRPKRGRPPKQAAKQEIEPQVSTDIYTTVPPAARTFLFTPEIPTGGILSFSSEFESREQPRHSLTDTKDSDTIAQKLAAIRSMSSRWETPNGKSAAAKTDRYSLDDEEPKAKRPSALPSKNIATKAKATSSANGKGKNNSVPQKKNGQKSNSKAPLRKAPPKSNSRQPAKPVETKKRPKRIIPRFKNTSGIPQKKMRVLPKAKSQKQIKAPVKRK